MKLMIPAQQVVQGTHTYGAGHPSGGTSAI